MSDDDEIKDDDDLEVEDDELAEPDPDALIAEEEEDDMKQFGADLAE
jgi:hypothetical protein